MTESAFQKAERIFSHVLAKLRKESRIDGATYFYFKTPLDSRPNLSLMLRTIPRSECNLVLLDLGCGMGALETKLHGEEMNVESVGLDLNRHYVHLAFLRQKLHGFDISAFVIGDVYHVPFREDAFDVMVLHDTAPALDIYRVIREDARVLRKIGTFVLDAPMKVFMTLFP